MTKLSIAELDDAYEIHNGKISKSIYKLLLKVLAPLGLDKGAEYAFNNYLFYTYIRKVKMKLNIPLREND